MIRSDEFLHALKREGFGLIAGVPCSYLTPLIDTLSTSSELPYVAAANEGEAVAIACGAELAGRRAVALFQNSGLGNAVNPLSSLSETFRIPILLLTTWRGDPAGSPDEPQHTLMGQITPKLFELLSIPWALLPSEGAELASVLARARTHMETHGRPFALIARKGTFAPAAVKDTHPGPAAPTAAWAGATPTGPGFDADEVLALIRAASAPSDALLATTGFTGRALYAAGDSANQLYMVGSMGCVSSLALGLAEVRPDKRILALDGDGAFLMRMGAVATIGARRSPNLTHICLDNGVHDSTGAQPTVSRSIDPAAVAHACGYPRVLRIERLPELRDALAHPSPELTFIHIRTRPRTDRKLPRPRMTPPQVAQRFREWLSGAG